MAKAAFVDTPAPYPVIPLIPLIPLIPVIPVIPAKAGIHFSSGGKSALTVTSKLALLAAYSVGESAL